MSMQTWQRKRNDLMVSPTMDALISSPEAENNLATLLLGMTPFVRAP
jgi:hypothetical protein